MGWNDKAEPGQTKGTPNNNASGSAHSRQRSTSDRGSDPQRSDNGDEASARSRERSRSDRDTNTRRTDDGDEISSRPRGHSRSDGDFDARSGNDGDEASAQSQERSRSNRDSRCPSYDDDNEASARSRERSRSVRDSAAQSLITAMEKEDGAFQLGSITSVLFLERATSIATIIDRAELHAPRTRGLESGNRAVWKELLELLIEIPRASLAEAILLRVGEQGHREAKLDDRILPKDIPASIQLDSQGQEGEEGSLVLEPPHHSIMDKVAPVLGPLTRGTLRWMREAERALALKVRTGITVLVLRIQGRLENVFKMDHVACRDILNNIRNRKSVNRRRVWLAMITRKLCDLVVTTVEVRTAKAGGSKHTTGYSLNRLAVRPLEGDTAGS